MVRTLATCAALTLSALAHAGEGKWTPQQVREQGQAWVKGQGFELPLKQLWDAKTGSGLLANAVQLPGCSGSFVSARGLLITNHHCVVGILQEHSSPASNLVRDGYFAKTPADEKPAKAYRIQVPRRFRDVTSEVQAALAEASAGEGDVNLKRFKSMERVQKALVAECEKQPKTRCQFAAFDGGLFFTLTEFAELTDVRLVYAPPHMVGDFGGETDNWSWPRHTGDFALLRVYQDGAPYVPPVHFTISTQGVKPQSAVAVLGYPGNSFRSLLASEMAERAERYFPSMVSLAGESIRIIEQEGERSPEAAIAASDELESLLNRRKNAEGQLAGLKRGSILEKQASAEAKVQAFAKGKKLDEALNAHAALEALMAERLKSWDRDFLLDALSYGPRSLAWGITVVRRSVEGQKADLEREPGYMERDLPRLREKLERDQKRFAPSIDRRLFASWVKRAQALPKEQRIAAVDAAFPETDEASILKRVDGWLKSSAVVEVDKRKALFEESPAQHSARKDGLLEFASAVDAERRALRDRRDGWSGAVLKHRPEWRKAVLAEAKRPVAPDANSTLRVTFCRVKGYSPRDAITYAPQTTMAGMLAKHAGADPFDVPQKVRDAAAGRAKSPWVDKALGDVPVDFLADCDTTGGNSGSPTIDAKGRLVGVNFDRVWENVANDFGYNPDVARNVNADVRYLLWLLESVEGGGPLLTELIGNAKS